MSRMIPPTLHPDVRSSAEKRIFRLFRDSPGTDGWIVLHSLGLARHQSKRRGEIDFVVICPRGVFALEAKGGRIIREKGIWKTTDRYGHREELQESPYDQASSAMFSLGNDIRQRFGDRHPLSSIILGYGVLFPNIPEVPTGTEGDREITYTLEDTRHPISRFVGRLAIFAENRGSGRRRRLTPDDILELTDFLRGDFDLVPPLWARAGETEEELLELTREQYRVADALESSPRVIIRGAAGTGKTVLARRSAVAAARAGKRVLFLCYNRLLASALSRELEKEPSAGSLEVHSVYRYMDRLIIDSGLSGEFQSKREETERDLFYSSLYPEYASLALMEDDFIPWDMIVVDEGQDFITGPVLDFLDLCLSGGFETGQWRWFMDDNHQAAVFGHHDRESVRRLERFGASHMLTVNCRNTVQVHEETGMLANPRIRAVAKVEGPPVRYAWYRSVGEQAAALERQLRRVLDGGMKPRDIVVLSARALTDCAARQLPGVPIFPLDETTLGIRNGDPRVAYATISGFKGLESEIVILTDVERLDGDWWGSVLYVGMSRARVELVVLLPEKVRGDYNGKVKAALGALTEGD